MNLAQHGIKKKVRETLSIINKCSKRICLGRYIILEYIKNKTSSIFNNIVMNDAAI